jgi:PAS domain S-box-containing protein
VLARTADQNAQRPRSLKRPAAPPKPEPPKRDPRPGFDDEARPLAVLGLDGRFRQLNPAFSKLVGYQEHEFHKAMWPSAHDRSSLKESQLQLRELATGELDQIEIQSTYLHGQGLMILVAGTLRLMRDSAGDPSHLLLEAEERQAGA